MKKIYGEIMQENMETSILSHAKRFSGAAFLSLKHSETQRLPSSALMSLNSE